MIMADPQHNPSGGKVEITHNGAGESVSPWQTLNSTPIYENPWISLTHHDVLNPAGKEGIYGVVSFKNLAIGVVPVDSEGYTWLVGQYRYTLSAYSWEICEGGGPLHLPALDSAKRELLEETGLVAQKWHDMGPIHTSNSVTDEAGRLYLAQELTQHTPEPEATEQLRLWRLPLSEAIAMVMAGHITDSLSIAGLLKADWVMGG
jgi:8-oxo-dGTP pyrophosphatase MutT (NUDIX family)